MLPLDLWRMVYEFIPMKDEYDEVMRELFLRSSCLGWLKPIGYSLRRRRCVSCYNLLCECESVITYEGFDEYSYLCMDCVFSYYLERSDI